MESGNERDVDEQRAVDRTRQHRESTHRGPLPSTRGQIDRPVETRTQ